MWFALALVLAVRVGGVFVPDPLVQGQWGVAAIGAPVLWRRGLLGSKSVRVCILDTGIDLLNADLASNVFNASDGTRGVNFVDPIATANVQDDNGHGTMVAGLIGAADNGIGVSGVAPLVTLLPCKFMGAQGQGELGSANRCFQFCRDNDAQVVHGSYGDTQDYPGTRDLIASMEKNGTLFVFSAGNDGMDTDRCATARSTPPPPEL